MADSSNVSILTNIFTAPNDAFASLNERPRLLLPTLLLIVSFTVVSFYYLSHVDMGWFLDNPCPPDVKMCSSAGTPSFFRA